MKLFTFTAGLVVLTAQTLAFPAGTAEADKAAITKNVLERQNIPGFNAKEQYVSTSGKHKFVPPNFAAGDQRGPCPGLNALANHGYLPHSGVGTIERMAQGTFEGVGLGEDIAQFFSAYGAFSSGNGLSWSIGGPPRKNLLTSNFPGFFGHALGISFSHNEYEGDGSACREDLYEFGNDYYLNLDFFKELYDALPADNLGVLSAHRGKRVKQQIAHNPDFFQGPFTGIGVVGAANSFVYRLFGNKSAENPDGTLTKEILKSFMGVSGPDDALVKHPGMERIPDNWYKRSVQDQYSFPLAFADLAQYAAEHPDTAKVGGNTNGVNTFTGVDVTNFTGGVFNAENFGSGNSLGCFAYQSAAFLAPDFFSKSFSDVDSALAAAFAPLKKALAPLGCPELKTLDTKQLKQYPGYRKSLRGQNGYPHKGHGKN